MYFLVYFSYFEILYAVEIRLLLIYSVLKLLMISFLPNSITDISPTLFNQHKCSELNCNYSDPAACQSISLCKPDFPLHTIRLYKVLAIMKCFYTLILIISKSLSDLTVTSFFRSFKFTLT